MTRSKLVLDGLQGAAQAEGAVFRAGQLNVGAGQVLRAGQQPEQIDLRGQNHLLREAVAHKHVIDGMAVVVALESEAGGGVGLRIAIHQQDFEAFQRQAGSKIDGGRGFAHSALLVDETENLAHGNLRVNQE